MSLLKSLAASFASQPCIPVQANNVRILHSPSQFYASLLEMVKRARHRIFLSSLYIDSSEDHLLQTLHNSLASNPGLNLHLHLDFHRSTRPRPTCTASLLVPLASSFPDRVHIHLFRSPKLKGVLRQLVPRRFDEGWGTWHAKLYGIDDEVLISGANLSKAYFTSRQDRYLHFTSAPTLSDYCFEFLRAFVPLSYRLRPTVPFALHWPNATVAPTETEAPVRLALTKFQSSQRHTCELPDKFDTLIFPAIQAGHFKIREEEECMSSFFSKLGHMPDAQRSLIELTSGYFALHMPYQDLLIHSPGSCCVIAAGPKANGFYGSKGVSGRIPEAYTLLEQRFWQKVLHANRAWKCEDLEQCSGIELREWEKNNWTYHAKGIWYRTSVESPPNLTLFGSTNLNTRSANLDVELSFIMLTSMPSLCTQLDAEVRHLYQATRRVSEKDWSTRSRRVRWGTRALLAAGIEGML